MIKIGRLRSRGAAISTIDETSRRILAALDQQPRATVAWLSEALSLARGTVQARMSALFTPGVLRRPTTVIPPDLLGYPMRAVVTAELNQSQFGSTVSDLRRLPEVVECLATAGDTDLQLHLVARDPAHLYEVGQRLLALPGIRRTTTALVLRELIEYRCEQLL